MAYRVGAGALKRKRIMGFALHVLRHGLALLALERSLLASGFLHHRCVHHASPLIDVLAQVVAEVFGEMLQHTPVRAKTLKDMV